MGATTKKKPSAIFLILFLASARYALSFANQEIPEMTAHCIDVGQGDATLLEFPCGAVLIDTGAQDNGYVIKLIDYLKAFFTRRSDLSKELESVFITHDHPDHIKGLEEVVKEFRVKRLIYNGKGKPKDLGELCRVLRNKNKYGLEVEGVTFEKVVDHGNRSGLTDSMIDPIACDRCDPKITVLSGGFTRNPGWSVEQFGNKNNHSLVIRVDFGKATFLFTGDLETDAIRKIAEYYRPANQNSMSMLDTDVLRVGHHGSHNATTSDLLVAVTPEIALISVGQWCFGKGKGSQFTTYAYGHPRKVAIDLLSLALRESRDDPVTTRVAIGPRKFADCVIHKKIYATAWDRTIQVRASSDGKYRVEINN